MANTVDAYREAKTTYLKLRDQAKKDLLAQFHQLAAQLFQIQRELQDDFGVKVPIPTRPKGRAGKSSSVVKTAESKPLDSKPVSSPAMAAIEKRLSAQQRKLDEASKAGKGAPAIQAIKDKIYELEDELRLATH